MSNNPKDAVIDQSKLLKNQTQNSRTINLNKLGNDTQSMITSLNEGAGMVGIETATKNSNANSLRSHETFSKNDNEKSDK